MANLLKPSPFDRRFWGCPRCGWPLDPADDWGDHGVTCACGAWVPLPDEPQPLAAKAIALAEKMLGKEKND